MSVRPKIIKTRGKEIYQVWVNNQLVAHFHLGSRIEEKMAGVTLHGFGLMNAGISSATITTRECIALNHKSTGEVDYTTIKKEDIDNGTS